jgi:hypothetical protein
VEEILQTFALFKRSEITEILFCIQLFAGSRRAEQLSLRSQQRIVATVEDSVLRTEMTGLESQEEDAPKRILFFKPMSWMGQIRSHRRDETWSASL